ncbi:MAG: ERCC4 domain-containing protein [Parvularcula sp.]|nr:ERCC4 domain-containing protein [Parvularcula sp.]
MNSETIPNYPARKKLSDLSKLRPVVIVDTREQKPLRFSRLASQPGTLQTGDYSFAGGEEHLAIERKSVADLVGCCMGDSRDRFFRELHRLRGFAFRRLLVIGTRKEIETGQYRSAIKPRSVLATLAAIEARFDVPVVFQPDPEAAAWQVEEWVWWYAREIVISANNLLPSRKR